MHWHSLVCRGLALAGALAVAGAAPVRAAGGPESGRHVVVVVFDGMRPDFVSEQTTPNLWRLAREGATFAHQHPVYCSATEVNGTAMATGKYPAHSFVIANVEYRPRIDPLTKVGLEVPATIRRGDAVSGGHYLGGPTVAEILHARGWKTVIAGSKQVALLHDRSLRTDPAAAPVVFEGQALPASVAAELGRDLGPFPPIQPDQDKVARDAWTTRALLSHLWRQGVPPYSLLWLAEPDISQHWTRPGSPQALAGIKGSDADLGLVLADLDRRGLRGSTDIFVISDHGFSTVGQGLNLATLLTAAGFPARRVVSGPLQLGEVMVVSSGGSSLLYVGGHESRTVQKLVAWLQAYNGTGVIFSRDGRDGTFPLTVAHVDSPEAPDLLIAWNWTKARSIYGVPGIITADRLDTEQRVGTHASLSPYDMHNTLVAAGPDIRSGFTDELASGNVDLAPTVLWLLGLKAESAKMDGRVLSEALTIQAPPLRTHETKRLTAQAGPWSQYVQISEVNGVEYLDEGDGRRSR